MKKSYEIRNGVSVVNRNAGKDNPFVGTPYESMWENNPYVSSYYEPTFWDNLGLSNKAKDANAEYNRLYNEYVSGLYEQMYQDEYNSESAQAQRQREAGLNPDLNGVTPSQAGEVQSPNAGMNPALNGQSPAVHNLQNLGSILSFAFSAYQGLSNLGITKNTAELQNFAKLTELAKPFVTQSYAEAFLNGMTPELSVASGRDSFGRQFKRMRKDAMSAFEHLFYSGDYKLQRDALKNMNDKYDDYFRFNERLGFGSPDDPLSSAGKFISEWVSLGSKELKIMRNSNISVKSKEKFLADFRIQSLEKMINAYRASGGHDILTGLLLAGMIESSTPSMLASPRAYLMGAGDKISKQLGSFIDRNINKGIDFVSNYF